MKTLILSAISILVANLASAEMQTWTNKNGVAIQLELLKVAEKNGELTGEFKMINGNVAFIKAADLSAADSARLTAFQQTLPAKAPAAGPASVFDKALEGNLLKLSGKSLKSFKDTTKPTKYYLFYYTASWCGPCHQFTPSLVEFYEKNKDPSFEVILITSDDDDRAMEKYAAEMRMPWPQLKLSKADKFKRDFQHPVRGIPNLVLTDLDGKIIKGSYEGATYTGPTPVMDHLATLLGK